MSGYALSVIEVLEKLAINSVVVFGWSLGGHIGNDRVDVLWHSTDINWCRTFLGSTRVI
ncbi:hypothetical protein [Xenorhabdus sp. Sc-CR9]|uniref:hypothetical protein n=1 Tax=Xenorhabdus sp. Sc-CR9 TaxID=2584468 RepID=UPI001F378921|nr:hypothetical protein [Xenorhabdus sp. Sc-CR9]